MKYSKLLVLNIFTLLVSTILLAGGKNAYEIKVKINGIKNQECYLAYHYGNKKYIQDTVQINSKSIAVFKGKKRLPGGIYLVVLEDKSYFEILIDEQNFEVETDTANLVTNMQVSGSKNNELFYGFLKFWQAKQLKKKKLSDDITRLKSEEKHEKVNDLNKKIQEINVAIKDYQENIIKNNPNLFYSKILLAMQEPKIPPFPRDDNGNIIDSAFQYNYYRNHYFDKLDLGDARLARTPIVHGKVMRYITKMTPQIPDSINKASDVVLQKSLKAEENFKYLLVLLLNKYANSKIMGMDAVYVHLVQNYYDKGHAAWVDSANLARISQRANTLKPLLIGTVAPDMVLEDINGNYVGLHKVKADYTIVFIWDPDCGHCKKATPKLKKVYDEIKAEGNSVEVYAANSAADEKKWRAFIEEKELTWINVADLGHHNYFRSHYDVTSTPKIYLLDKDKKIIAKRLGVEQMGNFLKERLGMKVDDDYNKDKLLMDEEEK